MNGIESDYFRNLEASIEKAGGEKGVEHIDYENKKTNDGGDFDIEEATASSLNVIGEIMRLGEPIVELELDKLIKDRADVIKRLMKKGKLDGIYDDLKEKINDVLFNQRGKVNNGGEGR